MTSRIELLGVAVMTLLACSCNGPATPHQIQNAHMDRSKELYAVELDMMADNAMLQDMAIHDIHFVAHTSELSGTGAARLDRMAKYLNTYGGIVRYEAHQADGDLLESRLAHVREYLTLSGCDMDRIKVENMMSGGRATSAKQAIVAEVRGTANPDGAAQTGQSAQGSMQPMGQ